MFFFLYLNISTVDKSYSKNGLISIRSALVEWSLNIGEPCKQIVEGKFFNDGNIIYKFYLICIVLNTNKFQKKNTIYFLNSKLR